MTAISGTCTLASLIAVGAHSDRTGERRQYVAGLALLAAVGWALSARADFAVVSFLDLVLAQAAMQSMWGPLLDPADVIPQRPRRGEGISLINAIGNLGAFVGPNIMGWLLQGTGDFAPGPDVMAFTLVLCAILALSVRRA